MDNRSGSAEDTLSKSAPEVEQAKEVAKRIIDAIPEALGITPDPWPEEPHPGDGEPHKTVAAIIEEVLSRASQPSVAPKLHHMKDGDSTRCGAAQERGNSYYEWAYVDCPACIATQPQPFVAVEEAVLAAFDKWRVTLPGDRGFNHYEGEAFRRALIAAVRADASREQDEKKDQDAGLIHQVASPLAETEPRLNKCVFCEHDITSCAGEVCDPCAVQANAVIEKFHDALQEHVAWCGFNKHAPGSSAFRDALNAYAEWRTKVDSGPPPAPAERAETTNRSAAQEKHEAFTQMTTLQEKARAAAKEAARQIDRNGGSTLDGRSLGDYVADAVAKVVLEEIKAMMGPIIYGNGQITREQIDILLESFGEAVPQGEQMKKEEDRVCGRSSRN
jgi:hypothetical protein